MKIDKLLGSIFALVLVTITLSSCLQEEEELVNVPDGFYIRGKATAFLQYDTKAAMKPAVNAVNGQARTGLYEIYLAVGSESKGFNIYEIVEGSPSVLGPVSREDKTLKGENGQITGTVQTGSFAPGSAVFRVPAEGIYHIIIDKQTSTYLISPVNLISLSKKVNNLWSDSEIPLTSGFDKTNIIFENKLVDLSGEYRIRYGHGDLVFVSGSEVAVFTYFGGDLTGSSPVFKMSMNPGDNTYEIQKKDEGKYTVDISWSAGGGFSAQLVKNETGLYPLVMFLTGDGISELAGADAWNWGLNNFEMIPANSKPYLFWKIVWLKNSGSIRFAPERGPARAFGKTGTGTDGLYSIGDQDVPVPGTPGFYMVAVNLQTGQISIAPPKIYLIGSSVNSWLVPDPAWQLTIDNFKKEISIIRNMVTGTVKMYVWQKDGWFTNWWDAEISAGNGKIIYRGIGPNLPAFNTETGSYTAVLNFYTGYGKFEKCTCGH